MKLYHTTPAADAILSAGFRDGTGAYLTDNEYSGVWLADQPLDINDGAQGDTILSITIPDDVVAPYEWVNETSLGHREFLVPAEIVDRYGPPVVYDTDIYGAAALDVASAAAAE